MKIHVNCNSVFINDIPVFENWAIPEDRFIHDSENNIIHIPENGYIYKILFSGELTKQAIDNACNFAKNKVRNFIKQRKY